MYKIEVDKDALLKLELNGNLTTITTEVMMSVMIVYQKLKQSDRAAAKQFKETIEDAIKSGFMFEDEEGRNDILKQRLDDLKKELFEMLGKDGDKK